MSELFDQIQEAARAIGARWSGRPRAGIILGTGLGGLVEDIAGRGGDPLRRRTALPAADRDDACRPAGVRPAGRQERHRDGGALPLLRRLFPQADHPARARLQGPGLRHAHRQQRLRRHEPAVGQGRPHGHRGPHQPHGRQPAHRPQRRPPGRALPRHVLSPTTANCSPWPSASPWRSGSSAARASSWRCRGRTWKPGRSIASSAASGPTWSACRRCRRSSSASIAGCRNLGLSVITDQCLPDALEPVNLAEIIAVANAAEKKLRVLVRRVLQEMP